MTLKISFKTLCISLLYVLKLRKTNRNDISAIFGISNIKVSLACLYLHFITSRYIKNTNILCDEKQQYRSDIGHFCANLNYMININD
jgi:hypothetical protein